jgi:Uma2 family endonuclease
MEQTKPALPGTVYDPRFPDADGRFMGDTDFHSDAIIWLSQSLRDFFGESNWYVAVNLILYWDQLNPQNRRDPDVLVARGVGNHRRRSFRVWEEGTLPCTLFEIASRRSWRQDIGAKRTLYAEIGVPEYFIFDPEDRYVDPPLQGFRLRRGIYVAIRPAGDGSLTSRQLGLRMIREGTMLRLIDAATGAPIPTPAERADQEKKRADELAAELKRLRARKPRRNGQHD